MRRYLARGLVAVLSLLVSAALTAQTRSTPPSSTVPALASAGGWITHPHADDTLRPVVLHFRRMADLSSKPSTFPVRVSADNRFILFVNGRRVVSGPSTGDLRHWRYTPVDLAPFLQTGRNVVSAVVWNFVKPNPVIPPDASDADRRRISSAAAANQTGRLAQQSAATGFWLEGSGRAAAISTRLRGWDVAIDAGHGASGGSAVMGRYGYYVASAPETIDLRMAVDMTGENAAAGDWMPAVHAPAAMRPITADPLPPQRFAAASTGTVVRTNLDAARGFPEQPVTIPARTQATLLIQREAMVSAYPELLLSGGRDAKVRLTYGEAMYDADNRKGDRDAFDGRHILGISDEIVADGNRHAVMPLWWRTWRYLEVAVETAGTPLTLEALHTWETGYPFEARGYFRSDDPSLDRIWQVGWRTALVDAHDTYMDSSFWEQPQYVGDTRLQMLISYAVSGDARLARQAIEAFAGSDVDDGLVEGAWPSRGTNSIATFSPLWIGMLSDWRLEQPDVALIARYLPRMRRILRWFDAWRTPGGLLGKNPQWNFVDWVGNAGGQRGNFPSFSKDGESCLTSILYLGALQQAADLENVPGGDRAAGTADRTRAAALSATIRARCYSSARQLFADDPDQQVFSQHMNALAVLYDVATPVEARGILARIVEPGHGIDAPAGILTSTYYFSWYLVRAFEHAGLSDRYQALLTTWSELLAQHYTTWPEQRGHTRSDSHAWSAHPTADLLRIVAGIGPGAPGYRSVRIAPALGALTRLDAAAMTPSGLVSVRYRIDGGTLHASITAPSDLPGWFEWQGRRHTLTGTHTELAIGLAADR